ncbi:alpha-xylosidase [Vibrio tritonius]|uniref:alpha-xylosidase n=1 Tax=Vibrio tritonius TaxID=1435069 RepID=UPI000838BE8C|nr:alpha-xylosidase [Vibrio tritonius]
MKISDGNWLIQKGLDITNPLHIHSFIYDNDQLVVYVSPKDMNYRANQLDAPLFTVTFSSPREGVIGVRYEHFLGLKPVGPNYHLYKESVASHFEENDEYGVFGSGDLTVKIYRDLWHLEFYSGAKKLTSSSPKSSGYIEDNNQDKRFMYERLDLGVGELVYGLGERFTSFLKNGQTVDIWNRDGGTSTEQAYKNIPFYLTNRGYGVYVNHPEKVSFEVASEKVSKVQFSVENESLEYFVIDGPTPKKVLRRYTSLTGKPALPPAWTFGLWLTTSFTTDYDEQTVSGFIEGMAQRNIPLHVFHFDCFWMKPFQWCDFEWDPNTFPDPHGMLQRLKGKGLKICVWINPYIGQKSPLFRIGMDNGYLLTKPNGSVWQWDKWQPGLAIVDFTNPEAAQWYCTHLERLMDMGVDCFKTDFGERIPTDVVWHDGADPDKMHNYYAFLYNKIVYQCIQKKRGDDDAVLFARSAAVGAQQFPVHWGGDCYANYESMAESLRGGLSIGLSGFGFWSHDIGGFEDTAPADVYKRWCAFGLLSSHSRLHGSKSYRVPWLYDEEACDVVRYFTQLKCQLMPYLYTQAKQTAQFGYPLMRAMMLEFPEDPTCSFLDQQYMLGDSLLVAPVFSTDGKVQYYLPKGEWTHLLNKTSRKAGWHTEEYGFMSLPLFVRQNTLLAKGACDDKTDYDFCHNVTIELYALQQSAQAHCQLVDRHGKPRFTLEAIRNSNEIHFVSSGESNNYRVALINQAVEAVIDTKGCDLDVSAGCLYLIPRYQKFSVKFKQR